MERSLEDTIEEQELAKELQEAEERWLRLLNDPTTGPKPRYITKTQKKEDPKYEIYPIPNVNKSRGGTTNKLKKQLGVTKHQLTYERDPQTRKILENEIAAMQQKIKLDKKKEK